MSENNHFEAPMAQAGHAPASSRGSSPDNDYVDVPGQRALPTTHACGRDATNRATPPSKRSDSEDDVSMNDIAMSTRGSSASGTTTPGGRKRAKKLPQRFSCTQFAPCSLTFTRSEHLARHIRKHTGERPFQCHCGRRFSRLDNLRQHSQTVHANEEIPADSLANTGGRGPYARDRKAILSRQNARPMQPLQQQHLLQGPPSGRHIGHRRNVHSMPVNQMAPMYGNYHDPRGAPAPSQMMDPRGPAFTYGQPVNRYYSPEPYQSPAAYNTPPSNRSSGNFGEYYQEPNYHAGFSFPMRNDATYGAPLRRQSMSSAAGPYFDMPMRGSMSGPQLPPLHSGVRESFHHQSANMFEQSPISTAPSEHSQYSPYARREESYHPMSEDPRRRTWHAGSSQRETYQLSQLSGGMHSMNITPPEEVRDRAYSYATRDNDSVHLPPIRTLEETPASPYRREPSPYQMEMRAAEAPAQTHEQVNQVDPSLRSETERSAADALASMGRRI